MNFVCGRVSLRIEIPGPMALAYIMFMLVIGAFGVMRAEEPLITVSAYSPADGDEVYGCFKAVCSVFHLAAFW